MSRAAGILKGRFGRLVLIEASTPLRPHVHPEHLAIIKLGGADARYRIGGHEHALTRDHVLFVNALEVHDNGRAAGHATTRLIALYLSPAWVAGALPAAARAPRLFPCARLPLPAPIRVLADALGSAMVERRAPAGGRSTDLLYELVGEVVGRFGRPHARRGDVPFAGDPRDARIARVLAQLAQARGDTVPVDDLVALAGLSRSRFFELFRDHTGLAPGRYADMLRLDEALRRLATDRVPISHLAADLGFAAQGNFTRFFVRQVGVAPSHYRRAVAHVEIG